ncbi:MAG TPA: cytochrome c oxidase subunit 3 family protein [Blastocatellia bacterium]|nr:cytochrome c oxidase subunit 3 family protein [Blastocatellia bacterium]
MAEVRTVLAHHFDNLEQQREAGTLGMWVFLITEVMFFGGLFTAYVVYRYWHPDVFVETSHHLDWRLGGINTVVLITSSLTMALAVYASQRGKRRMLIANLIFTLTLGLGFLAIKAVEYYDKYAHHLVPNSSFQWENPNLPQAKLFFAIYFAMTGMHAFHMIIGAGIMIVLIVMSARGRFSPEYHAPVELSGLYWHFVDIVWIFLFPLLYLIGRH